LRLREALSLGGLSPRELALRTWARINEHEITTRAAAVSFYAMLALVPFLALILTVTVQLLPDLTGLTGHRSQIGTSTAKELSATLDQALPENAAKVIEAQIAEFQKKQQPPMGLLLTGLAVTVWLASSLFVAIIDAMNQIYGVHESRSFLKTRLTAIVMTCIEAVILVGSLLVIVLWPQIVGWFGMSEQAALLATAVQWLVVAVAVLLSFALAFYVGPDADQRWEWITPGSLLGTVAFLAASYGFRVYVQHFAEYDKTYGSLGGVMVLMFWFWISSLVLLTAAQMNKVIEDASPLGKRYGQKVDTTEAPDLKAIKPEPLTR
jgi:membrane protein